MRTSEICGWFLLVLLAITECMLLAVARGGPQSGDAGMGVALFIFAAARVFAMQFLVLASVLLWQRFSRRSKPERRVSWRLMWTLVAGPLCFVLLFGLPLAGHRAAPASECAELIYDPALEDQGIKGPPLVQEPC